MPEIIDLGESDCQNSDSFGSIDGKEEIENFGVKMRDISADDDTDISIVELSNDEDFESQTSKDENKTSKGNVESHSKMSKDENETSKNKDNKPNDKPDVVSATKKCQDIRNFFFKMNGEAKKVTKSRNRRNRFAASY
jgi:hypothetical protein